MRYGSGNGETTEYTQVLGAAQVSAPAGCGAARLASALADQRLTRCLCAGKGVSIVPQREAIKAVLQRQQAVMAASSEGRKTVSAFCFVSLGTIISCTYSSAQKATYVWGRGQSGTVHGVSMS
jgi:hypothetical protein